MLELEIFDLRSGAQPESDLPSDAEVLRLCELAAGALGVTDGHVAVEFVDAERIAELNASHRDKPGPTDVLSFPIDGAGARSQAPRELGDVIICPQYAADICEAILHGVLHLLGMDHERDDGAMLALQRELLASVER